MNADILAMLGGAGIHGGSSSRRENEAKSILEFKAGKMSTSLKPNGKYWVTPDPRRGLLSLTWTSGSSSSSAGVLKMEWKDRRTRAVVDTFTIAASEECTYEKVDTGREGDRIFMFSVAKNHHFYWMQDKLEDGKDEEDCVKMNTYMTDTTEAAKAAGEEPPADTNANTATTTTSGGLDMSGLGSGGLDNAALMQVMQGLGTDSNNSTSNPTAETPIPSATNATNNTTSTPAPPQGQVDALSNILENLGMPQPNAVVETPASNTSSTSMTAGGGTLTLADLQGAMAGLATTSPPSSSAPLSEVVSSEAVLESGILNNEELKSKLIALLPEGQQTEEFLVDNLRSPQAAQCWKSLTAALAEDPDSLPTILANFQLPPSNNPSLNPIQAFLDAVLASVETKETSTDETKKE